MQTYSNNDYIYSVDMMFSYIMLNKPKFTNIKVEELVEQLNYDGWGDPINNIKYSAIDVINNPSKYKNEYDRIKKADLNYPIIISSDGYVVDGIHRLSNAYLNNVKTIKAYKFNDKIMKKFILAKSNEWDKVDNIKSYNLINLYASRFCKK